MTKKISLVKISSLEDKTRALNDRRVSITVFQMNGTLYLTSSLRADLSKIIPGCRKAGSFKGNYFIECLEEDFAPLLEEHLKKQVIWL